MKTSACYAEMECRLDAERFERLTRASQESGEAWYDDAMAEIHAEWDGVVRSEAALAEACHRAEETEGGTADCPF